MNVPPLTADRIQKVIRTEHTNAVLNTPPMFSKRSTLGNSINQTANVHLKPEHKKAITPLSSAPIRFWRDKAKASSAIGFDIDDGIQQVTVVPSYVGISTNLMEQSGGSHSNDIIDKISKPPPYPFSHCYMNVDGFLCCNRYLESVMRQSYQKLREAYRFNECSVQKIVNRIQTDCENAFNTTFETVVGIDDFAIRAHFVGDLLCKIHEGGRFIASYATTMPTREGVPLDPLHVVTNIEMNLRDKEALHPESVNDTGNGIEPATQSDVPGFGRRDQEDIPFYEKSRGDIDNHNMVIS